MILEFKTSNKNTYGHRKYLAIDTGAEGYSTNCHSCIITGIEIKTADYKELIKKLESYNFKKVEYIY